MTKSTKLAVGVSLSLLLAPASAVSAQARNQTAVIELRLTGGGLLPTGVQRNSIKNADQTTAQVAWLVHPSLAITGAFSWARSRDVSATNSPKLDVFTSDLGVEARPDQWFADRAMTLNPFIGAGAGVRSYNYRKLDVDATHNLAGYAAAGGEVGYRRVGVRLEVRDYVSGFKPLAGAGSSDARSSLRNDVVMLLGLRFKH